MTLITPKRTDIRQNKGVKVPLHWLVLNDRRSNFKYQKEIPLPVLNTCKNVYVFGTRTPWGLIDDS